MRGLYEPPTDARPDAYGADRSRGRGAHIAGDIACQMENGGQTLGVGRERHAHARTTGAVMADITERVGAEGNQRDV